MLKQPPAARLDVLCPPRERLIVLCPRCESDALKATDIGPDLRTITVRCTECGRESVMTVSE